MAGRVGVEVAFSGAAVAASAMLICGCTPALDWRDVRVPGAGVTVMLPCKPSVYQRQVPLGGQPVALRLHACQAGGATWAVADADVGMGARVDAALIELLAAARANVQGQPVGAKPWSPRGAPAGQQSARESFAGFRPDGTSVQEAVGVFSVGARVFQLTVVANRLDADAVEFLFASVRVGA